MEMMITPSFSNHMPGAVPNGLVSTVQAAGTWAWSRFSRFMGIPLFRNLSLIWSKVGW
jgi:hypothetical protein